MTLSARDTTMMQESGQEPPPAADNNNRIGNNNNNNLSQKHRASQQKAVSSGRGGLHSMGSLMDFDDEENQPENRAPSSQSNTNSRQKNTQQEQQSDENNQQQLLTSVNKKKPVPLGDKTCGVSVLAHVGNNVLASSSNMVRQHRRRLLAGGQIAASLLTPHNNNNGDTAAVSDQPPAWDGLVRKGTKLKSFLGDAMQHVATGYSVTSNVGDLQLLHGSNKRQRLEGGNMEMEGDGADYHLLEDGTAAKQNQHFVERELVATSVAKDKAKEALLLKQQLEEAQAQVAALTASNNTLREETTASSLRFERTIEALKISAANAACARTDADQAEASADGLTTQLEALKTVVEQTKQAAQVMHEEQQEIEEQSRNGQAKLLKVEAELARSQKETRELRETAQKWQTKTNELQEEATTLKRQIVEQQEEARKLTNALEERDALEAARKQRSQQLEQELTEAQALLVDASSKAADDETLVTLQANLKELQTANTKLHEQLTKQEETAQEETARLKKTLNAVEEEAKQLRIEASLNNDKKSANENINGAVSPGAGDDSPFAISTTLNMATPTAKDTYAVPPAATCSVCFKAAFGLMKSCQCGRPECGKRAHLTCANRVNPGPSVSHPGTPAPKLPLTLCSGALAGIITN